MFKFDDKAHHVGDVMSGKPKPDSGYRIPETGLSRIEIFWKFRQFGSSAVHGGNFRERTLTVPSATKAQ